LDIQPLFGQSASPPPDSAAETLVTPFIPRGSADYLPRPRRGLAPMDCGPDVRRDGAPADVETKAEKQPHLIRMK